MTAMTRVIEALEAGATTTGEIALFTGIATKHVSTHLQRLREMGVVVATGRMIPPGPRGGRPANAWAIK